MIKMIKYLLVFYVLIFSACFAMAQVSYTCTHKLELYDIYGDGWNGASVDLKVNGSTIENNVFVNTGALSAYGASKIIEFQAQTGDNICLDDWQNGYWDSEIVWAIKDGNGNVINSGEFGDGLMNVAGYCAPCEVLVHDEDFQSSISTDWSSISTTTAAYNNSTTLGPFGYNDIVSLNLNSLTAHTLLKIEFDLYVLGTLDGNHPIYGPDTWELELDGTNLISTNFSNFQNTTASGNFSQIYPGIPYTSSSIFANSPNYVAYTGSTVASNSGSKYAIYAIKETITHTSSTAVFDFQSFFSNSSLSNESWAIDNVKVYVLGTEGCTNPSACNYNVLASCDDGSCLSVYGCTDSISCNYNVLATCDDGSCIFNPSTVTASSTCPGISDGVISLSVSPIISGVIYTYTINNGPITSYTNNTNFLSGTNYAYEFFIDGISCGVETITINEYPAMTLQTNVFDSICDSSNASVSVTVPQIVIDTLADITAYCASSPFYSANICVIDSVVLVGDNSTINNLTPAQNGDYFDYTNLYTDVTLGQSYFLDVQLNSIYAPNISAGAKVYIDWNIDGDFTDPGEQIGVISNLALPNVMSIPIIVPLNATSGATLMRIVCNYNEDNSITSCNSSNFFQWGDVEDYTIVINSQASAVGLTYLWSPIGGNDSIANNLAAGIYTVTVMDVNGCIATETAIVGATLPVSVIANSDQTICNGGVPANLTAIGISSAGAYTWWPSSAFTNPNLQNPSFNSAVNTTTVYTVTFTDSNGCIANDSVIITVNPVPSVTLLGLPNPACLGDNIILTASASMPVNRYRFQYNSGIGWVNMSAPAFDVINPVTFFNITTTTNFRLKVREYNSCTNSSWSSIITVPISTIVTPPISHN